MGLIVWRGINHVTGTGSPRCEHPNGKVLRKAIGAGNNKKHRRLENIASFYLLVKQKHIRYPNRTEIKFGIIPRIKL